ncbi:MAG: EAL domain-containing protein [Sulfurimonas sp.]|nr:EAL domain-containing protein [Sulfurimonas sp.]
MFVVKDIFIASYIDLEKNKVKLITQHMTPSLCLSLSYEFKETTQEIINNALLDENVLLIEIQHTASKQKDTFTKHQKTLQEYSLQGELFNSVKMIDPATQEEIAQMTLVYSKKTLQKSIDTFEMWIIYGVIGFALSILALAFLLYRSLKNLKILDTSLQDFNPQKPQKLSLKITSNDEVASISKSANIMIDNIIKFINISKDLNTQLFQNQEHLKEAQEIASVGSLNYNFDDDTLILSDEYYRLLELEKGACLTWAQFLSFIGDDDYARVKKTFHSAIKMSTNFNIQYMLKLPSNKNVYVKTKGSIDKDDSKQLTAVSMDITQDVQNKKTIEKLAYFDPLTGLANRVLLKDRIEKALQNAKRNKESLAILFLDLDHFKLINDTLGHGIGDDLLVYISNVLQKEIRVSDTLARIGGDEFVILLSSIKNEDNVHAIAKKILESLQEKHIIGVHELYISSSIGIALYPQDGINHETLVRNADTAMYEAKNNGRNKYELYTQSMGDFTDKQLDLEQALSEAVKSKSQIEVYYQVKLNAQTNSIAGAEALVRWNHPSLGLVFPDDFIPMAESTGLMVELGNIITEQAIASIKEFNLLGYPAFKIAINLSARQFGDANLISYVQSLLVKYDVHPKYIEFEITETISMTNTLQTLKILEDLKALGVSIAIDDFGTGHSSLSYLKKFPIDILKIDQSFVRQITSDEDDRTIAKTIINMAHSLGLKTVAEGVETQEHSELLKSMDCDLLQGYLYSKPISKDNFIKFLKESKKD